MIVDLPSTDTSAVNRKMVQLRESAGAVALGRVLTLVISTVDGPEAEQAIQAANDASREHPCRVLVLARGQRQAATRLDAQIRIGGDAGASEVIVLRMYGPLADHGGSIIVPLLLPDAPIVTWWPGEPPTCPSADPVGAVAGRRITDVSTTESPARTLLELGANYHAGDTDLAWSRITGWRALITSALDEPPYEAVTRAEVDGLAESASADLLAGWLSSRLDVPVTRRVVDVPGGHLGGVRLERPSGTVELTRQDSKTAKLTQPGQPVRRVALPRRTARDCLAEELRRLDPDEIFHEALEAISRVETPASSAEEVPS
ncbi:glucose-6-phosphate dehydrogenase assembly protein OpcA [Actinomycetospora soli]|uniref:glucose-6-phosphate dehydrogenase assembly protein OpcA n=1 Tax=Actinomycetospora soli TaxID=2893887 RepID=UPI001E2E40C5|nr:glucose-6-phosphate dehydrogenase assembly protein OpcA [Actinomycetospora soli]MCD2187631.1 glucose-6-phosphate dehydrogenase assembly protein OpcA [Actinomycetospora soli]